MRLFLALLLILITADDTYGQINAEYGSSAASKDTIDDSHVLNDLVVRARARGKMISSVANTELIGRSDLVRAACCNLGESFTTNPSVDVTYSDAATGARQIKLLGLSGTYVQMLTENMPNLRGASMPYSLGYVPGPWLQSIQVSKGASSVKSGYESISGQINIEYFKPQGIDGVRANAYLDSKLKQEVNFGGGLHISDRLSMSAMMHFENRQSEHDGDGDGFMDMPKIRQWNGMWRMAYVSPVWISQLSVKGVCDERTSGMSSHGTHQPDMLHYGIDVNTDRLEVQWKNGFILDGDHNTSIAIMANGSIHDADYMFGTTCYDVKQKTMYAQLMFETDFSSAHNLSVGASIMHDSYDQMLNVSNAFEGDIDNLMGVGTENTWGMYAQYTYKLNDMLTIMPGIRWDYSTYYGGFVTPRAHTLNPQLRA